jgi:hypothetical protein
MGLRSGRSRSPGRVRRGGIEDRAADIHRERVDGGPADLRRGRVEDDVRHRLEDRSSGDRDALVRLACVSIARELPDRLERSAEETPESRIRTRTLSDGSTWASDVDEADERQVPDYDRRWGPEVPASSNCHSRSAEIPFARRAAVVSRAWVTTSRWPDGSPLTNTRPSRVSTTAARGEFCPAVTARPALVGPVRFSIAAVRGLGVLGGRITVVKSRSVYRWHVGSADGWLRETTEPFGRFSRPGGDFPARRGAEGSVELRGVLVQQRHQVGRDRLRVGDHRLGRQPQQVQQYRVLAVHGRGAGMIIAAVLSIVGGPGPPPPWAAPLR